MTLLISILIFLSTQLSVQGSPVEKSHSVNAIKSSTQYVLNQQYSLCTSINSIDEWESEIAKLNLKNFSGLSDDVLDFISSFPDSKLSQLNIDLGTKLFKDAVKGSVKGVKAWEILSIVHLDFRTNPKNLEKLSRFIEVEGVDIAKLKSSLANTKDVQKWIDLKLPKSELDNIYSGLKNDPPFEPTPWTPQHKAQRWKNYEEGCLTGQNTCQDFETWSNGYDGKIDLVTNANQSVNNYFSTLGWNCSASPCREVTLQVTLNGQVVNRRLDIYDAVNRRAKEFKEYSSGKVYKSEDIVNEVLRDKQLMSSGDIIEMEWVFKGCEPSGPLRTLLESGPNTITIILIP